MFFFESLCKICKNDIKKIVVCSITLSSAFIVYDQFVGKALPWNVDTAFIALVFICFGYWLSSMNLVKWIEQKTNVQKLSLAVAFAIVSILLSSCNQYLCGSSFEMWGNRYGLFPITVSAACMGSASVIVIASAFQENKFLEWLGQNTIAFFAFHQSIGIVLMKKAVVRLNIPDTSVFMFWTSQIFIFAGTFLICYIIHILLLNLNLGFVVGKHTSRKETA